MRKYWLGVMAAAAFLTFGCGRQTVPSEASEALETGAQISIPVEETPAPEAPEAEADESLSEAWASLEAAEESLKAREESLEAEETRPSEESTPLRLYRKLAEDPESHKGQAVVFSGNVIRAASDGAGNGQVVLAVEGRETARLVCDYRESLIDEKLMAGDQVTVSGIFQDLNSYRMDSGSIETLPAIRVSSFDTVTLAVRRTAQPQAGASRGAEPASGNAETAASGAQAAESGQTADPVILEDEEQIPASAFPETADPEIVEDDQGTRASRVVGPADSSDMTGPGVERPSQSGEIGPGAGS